MVKIYLSFRWRNKWDFNRSQTARRIPNNSKPTKISHEPGVKGVTSAKKPKIIKITPTIFLVGESLLVIGFSHDFQSGIKIYLFKYPTLIMSLLIIKCKKRLFRAAV